MDLPLDHNKQMEQYNRNFVTVVFIKQLIIILEIKLTNLIKLKYSINNINNLQQMNRYFFSLFY
jgi:hypothetical protein